ncbi:MAG: SH3 domain-containing protein [Chloroflexi bacterium]|nr:SH3 domain-containing protein [Chloroflexota bacterium]
MDTLISLSPFLILIYILFAFVQVFRHQRQSFGAAILGLIVLAIPVIAYFVSSDVAGRTSLMNSMVIGTAVFGISCLVILLIERRDSKRDKKRSYGILGLGMSVVLAGVLVVMSLTQGMSTQEANPTTADFPNADNFVNISQPNTGQNMQSSTTGTTEVAAVLTAQTGLSTTDLTTQLNNGSTIAQLVAANNGDLEAVKVALVTALNALETAGGMPAQMLSNFGTDTTDIATKVVEGELPARAQQMLANQLISGNSASPQGMPPQNGNGGFTPPSGSEGSTFPTGGNDGAPANSEDGSGGGFTPPSGSEGSTFPAGGNDGAPANSEDGSGGGFVPPANANQQAAASPMPSQNNVQVAAVQTEVVMRPTLIAFPTATPTPDATEVLVDETASSTTAPTAVGTSTTCTIVVVYNLNLRDKPALEGSTVLLSIPYGTTVTSSGHTHDDWYQVTYEGQLGWVSGEYVTPQAACSQLATLTG